MKKSNIFHEFPKAGNWVVVTKRHQFANGTTIEQGDFAEVLETQVHPLNGEVYSYFIYLGLESGHVLELNYTIHFDKFKIVPPTEASKVLYGNK